jgi:hypothetical protein
MAIQRLEEIPLICLNRSCPNYKGFELVDVEDILKDELGDYINCNYCFQRIDIKD